MDMFSLVVARLSNRPIKSLLGKLLCQFQWRCVVSSNWQVIATEDKHFVILYTRNKFKKKERERFVPHIHTKKHAQANSGDIVNDA